VLLALAGCASPRGASAQRVEHVVLVKLREPGAAPELVAACQRELAGLASVSRCRVGRPLDIGRPEVAADWDVGLVIEFDSVADYQRYLADERHAALVTAWKPRWERITIQDVLVDFAD